MLSWLFKFGFKRQVSGAPSVWERRRDFRVRCRLSATCCAGDSSVAAELIDIGPRGVRLEADEELKPGTPVRISCRPGGMLLGRQRLPYKIAWCRDAGAKKLVGAALDGEGLAQTWVEHVLRMMGLGSRLKPRKFFRAPLTAPAEMLDLEGRVLAPAQVRDLSMQGALVATTLYREEGETVRFKLGPTRRLGFVELPARILATRLDENGERLVHLRFFGCSPEQQDSLERYVRNAIGSMVTSSDRSW